MSQKILKSSFIILTLISLTGCVGTQMLRRIEIGIPTNIELKALITQIEINNNTGKVINKVQIQALQWDDRNGDGIPSEDEVYYSIIKELDEVMPERLIHVTVLPGTYRIHYLVYSRKGVEFYFTPAQSVQANETLRFNLRQVYEYNTK